MISWGYNMKFKNFVTAFKNFKVFWCVFNQNGEYTSKSWNELLELNVLRFEVHKDYRDKEKLNFIISVEE